MAITTAYRRATGRRLAAGVSVALAASLAFAGCGSEESQKEAADASVVAEAQSQVEKAMTSPGFTLGEDLAFDASKASGKNVWIIDISSALEIIQVSDKATEEALGLVGSKVTTFDGKGDASEFARGIKAAINDRADAIVLYAIDPNLVDGPLQEAADADIPVIAVQYGDPSRELPETIVAQVTYPYTEAGAQMANAVAADADGEPVGVQLINSSDVSNAVDVVGGFEDTLEENCPNCTLYVDDIPVADWQNKISTQVNSTLNSHPDIKYVVPVYDGMATFAIPGIKSSGRQDVSVVSFNASKSVMKYLADGDTVIGEVGSPQAWEGYALADQLMRVLSGVEPLADEEVGLRLFTNDNIDEIDLDAPEEEWYGVDFRSEYKKLWGLS